MLYQLLFNTHYFLLYTSYIFLYLYFYMFLYVYLYIFLRFSYGQLTVGSTIFSTVVSLYGYLLQLPPYGQPDGWLYSSLYVFLYDFLYGYLIHTSFSSFILYILYYPLFILIIDLHCILNTIFYYIFTPTPF